MELIVLDLLNFLPPQWESCQNPNLARQIVWLIEVGRVTRHKRSASRMSGPEGRTKMNENGKRLVNSTAETSPESITGAQGIEGKSKEFLAHARTQCKMSEWGGGQPTQTRGSQTQTLAEQLPNLGCLA